MPLPVIAAPGTFASVVSVGKAFAVTHPVGLAFAGGALLTLTTTKYFKNKRLAKKLEKAEQSLQAQAQED
ncbi:hypothetical protein [Leucothrix arctica]|uniref:Uncharacterized protein n=1 Tax=Leucothrix arctica TaxID=1481894 RepID=A0A317CF68_9GAMM|nr:hypothetical protein [Leucothrix arctica]PWQ97156.1 hypothetical protein DKT75_07525 [Leucothrix arctica]